MITYTIGEELHCAQKRLSREGLEEEKKNKTKIERQSMAGLIIERRKRKKKKKTETVQKRAHLDRISSQANQGLMSHKGKNARKYKKKKKKKRKN